MEECEREREWQWKEKKRNQTQRDNNNNVCLDKWTKESGMANAWLTLIIRQNGIAINLFDQHRAGAMNATETIQRQRKRQKECSAEELFSFSFSRQTQQRRDNG